MPVSVTSAAIPLPAVRERRPLRPHPGGPLIRVVKVQEFTPAPFTILGWEVPSIEDSVTQLAERGIVFEQYGMDAQDARGIWTSPAGARVAWFKDPDGNVLSVSQCTPDRR